MGLTILDTRFHSQDSVGFGTTTTHERLDAPFLISPGIMLPLGAEYDCSPEGRFSSNLYRDGWRNAVHAVRGAGQQRPVDTVSRVMGWQSRFRWILRPGNDLYVVYTHNWREDPLVDRFTSLDRRASSKLLYTHRF